MGQHSSGILWLAFGLLLGLAALALLAVGSFAIVHTHKNVRTHEEILERDLHEMEQLKATIHLPQNKAKADELVRRVDSDRLTLYDYQSYRIKAILLAGASLLPGVPALIFLAVFTVKFLRRPAAG